MTKHIVYTRHSDGGVSVCTPTPEFLAIAKHGGWWNHLTPRQIEKQLQSKVARGVAPEAARRFAIAMLFGGLNEEQAYELLRDHDCTPLGRSFEMMDSGDLPDREHRNHWRRSANGGPIWVNSPAGIAPDSILAAQPAQQSQPQQQALSSLKAPK